MRAANVFLGVDVGDVHPGADHLFGRDARRLQRLERDRKSRDCLPVRVTGIKHTIWTGRRRASCDGPISGHHDAGVAVDRFPRR